MSTATDFLNNVPGPPSVGESSYRPSRLELLGDAIARFAPIHDWVSFTILQWMMINVGWSVMLAGWGDLPSVIPTLMLGTVAAFVGSKLDLSIYIKTAYAIVLGFLVVMWRGTPQAAGDNVLERAVDGVSRFSIWIDTAQTGGISTDTVPFALMFMTAAWIVGYGVTALTFRLHSPWLPTVLLSLVILTNLSYRHGQHEHTYFLFLVGGIALFAHLTTVRRIERWTAQGIEYSRNLAWTAVQDGLLFALPIVLLSALLPIWEPRSVEIQKTWDLFRTPFYALQEPANRLLAGVDGPGSSELFSTPSQTMAFGGSINLTEEPLMWVRSKYVVPHAGRVYQTYTSEGWLTDPNTTVGAAPRSALTLAPTELERERVSLAYVPLVDTRTVVPAGGVFSVDRETEVQVLNPLEWRVPLTGSVRGLSELPPDLRDIAFAVRFAVNDLIPVDLFRPTELRSQNLAPPELVEEVLQALGRADTSKEPQTVTRAVNNEDGTTDQFETVILPISPEDDQIEWADLVFELDTESETGLANRMLIGRNSPVEQVGVVLSDEISKEDTFSIQTFVTLATDEQLNESGDDYPTWISDRYLPLPSSLPNEVRDLASQIVRDAEAETPFEKAEAIKAFLKDQEYSLEIEGPEFGVDGLFYFLFQPRDEPCSSVEPDCDRSKIKGYSQYFGSSAAVLLRAVGVPARFVAGWSPGEYIPEAGMFLVRDNDRHGWTQVYFPDYGWIDYEVTPGRIGTNRGQLAPTLDLADPFAAGGVGSAEEDPDFLQDIADLERLAREARGEGGDIPARSGSETTDEFVFPWRPFAWAGGVIAVVLAGMFVWWLSLRNMDAPTRAYARMTRIAWLLGMKRRPNETSLEFATNLGARTVAAMEPATHIAIEFQRRVYAGPVGNTDRPDDYEKDLTRAWRKVARALIAHRIRQLGGIGPELGESRNV